MNAWNVANMNMSTRIKLTKCYLNFYSFRNRIFPIAETVIAKNHSLISGVSFEIIPAGERKLLEHVVCGRTITVSCDSWCHQQADCLFNRLLRLITKIYIHLYIESIASLTFVRGFHRSPVVSSVSQRDNNTETVSMTWNLHCLSGFPSVNPLICPPIP